MPPPTQPPPDLECWRCGCDLRGIDEHAACPECGVPVENSLAQFKRYGSPRRLRSIRVGLICMFVVWLGLSAMMAIVTAAPLWISSVWSQALWMVSIPTAFSFGGGLQLILLAGRNIHRPLPRWDSMVRVLFAWLVGLSLVFMITAALSETLSEKEGHAALARWTWLHLLGFTLVAGYLASYCRRLRLLGWHHLFDGLWVSAFLLMIMSMTADSIGGPWIGVWTCLQLIMLAGIYLLFPIALLGLHNTLGLLLAPPPYRENSDV